MFESLNAHAVVRMRDIKQFVFFLNTENWVQRFLNLNSHQLVNKTKLPKGLLVCLDSILLKSCKNQIKYVKWTKLDIAKFL